MSNIVESLYRVNNVNLNESNSDKKQSMLNKIEHLINRSANTLDTVVNGDVLTVGQADGKTASYVIDVKTVYKYTLVSSESGEQVTNIKNIQEGNAFVSDCAASILDEVHDILS